MATNVFISWSGEPGGRLAEAIRQWLPAVLQFVKPSVSSSDADKDRQWASKVSTELKESQVGIVCLTLEALSDPWILFEAGALSRNLALSQIYTIYFDTEPAGLPLPLGLFRNVLFTKEGIQRLLKTINKAGDTPLEEPVLNEAFETGWPQLEMQVTQILAEPRDAFTVRPRTDREILEEILELTRAHTQRKADIPRSKVSDSTPRQLGRFTAKQLEKMGLLWDEFLNQLAPDPTPAVPASPDEIREELEKEIEKGQEQESSDTRDGPSDTRDARKYQKRY
jgi:hypothetical protein